MSPSLGTLPVDVTRLLETRLLVQANSGGGKSWALRRLACVTPATTSGHLRKLLDAGFVVCEPRGRHKYFRLADPDIAHALEAMALVAERGSHDRTWATPERTRLRYARCCYGHLAGQLSIRLFDALQTDNRLKSAPDGFELTDSGKGWLEGLGLRAGSLRAARRYAYRCLDWSERRDHLAGQLADEIYAHLIELGWVRRSSGRAVELTPRGHEKLLPLLES